MLAWWERTICRKSQKLFPSALSPSPLHPMPCSIFLQPHLWPPCCQLHPHPTPVPLVVHVLSMVGIARGSPLPLSLLTSTSADKAWGSRTGIHTHTQLKNTHARTSSHTWMHDDPDVSSPVVGGGVTFGRVVFFLCLGLFLNGLQAFYSALFLIFLVLFCTPGQMCFWITMCDGCDMYLVLCACIIYTYNTKQTCIHTQFIYYFSLCIKIIYRYMYINYNGSQIIYGELISVGAVAIFAAA